MKTVEVQDVLIRLNETVQELPELAEVIDLQRELLETNRQVRLPVLKPSMSKEQVHDCLLAGTPLLRRQPPELDGYDLSGQYLQVCQVASRHRPEFSFQFERLASFVEDDPVRVRELSGLYLKGSKISPALRTDDEPEIPPKLEELAKFVLLHSLRPYLQACAVSLAPLIDERIWQRQVCPVCGGEPDLAYLDARGHTRHLVCPRCDFTWLFPRIKCPFCLTSQSSDLAYFPSEDEKYRLYVCYNCKRYLKAVDLSKTGSHTLLPVERVVTLPMDFAAREYGYS